MKKGLLLVNLGTPSAPTPSAVRTYLRDFLSDKRVIDLPAPLRWLLLNAFILPFRPKKTAHAYQAIWTPDGSPLLTNSLDLLHAVQAYLASSHIVRLAMRYGEPSLQTALHDLAACDELTILPLFPQYASATTGSIIEDILTRLSSQLRFPSLHIIRDFYQNASFIQAQAAQIKPFLDKHEHILFSYHGLPVRQIQKNGCTTPCLEHCPHILPQPTCYRAQCLQTTTLLAEALALSSHQYSSAFQSRLGRTPWITPYTDETLAKLAEQGLKRLAIVCPSFVTDCLETLEEIGLRAQAQWLALGGETLTLIPCVNDHPHFVQAIAELIHFK